LAGFLEKKSHQRLTFVFNTVVEDGILEVLLEDTHLAGRLEMKEFHDLVAVDDRLEEAFIVLDLQVGEFFANHTEILEEHPFFHLVLRCDIRLAEQHEVVDVVASIV
jgi:hypothetical protein